MKKSVWVCAFLLSCVAYAQTEESPTDHSYRSLVLKLDDTGTKYLRFITWHQVWAENGDLSRAPGPTFRLRRSRLLAFAQISPRFLILTHVGLNNLTTGNMDPVGDGRASDAPQWFLHAAWNEFKVLSGDELYVGAGLHYWNGLSRLTSQSTLNFMTLDNYRQAWAQLGLSDQFARHLGIYAKGLVGKLRYTVSVNEAIANALGSVAPEAVAELPEGTITYSGRRVLGEAANLVTTAYADYQFLDRESNKLPYRVGSYLGAKRVFNVGAGFFAHPNGTVRTARGAAVGHDVLHWSIDVFYDAPLGKGAVNTYAAYHHFDYGPGYALGTTYGTGNSFYGHLGYLLPVRPASGYRFMPYVAGSVRDFEAFEAVGRQLQFGMNWFVNGHNAKVTLEWTSTLANHTGPRPDAVSGLVLQTHIFL